MLQNRNLKIVVICLIIAISRSEQRQQNQGQKQGHRNSQSPQTRQLEQIKSQEHNLKAKEMLKYMNTEADVCKDIYEYACGNWLQAQNTDMINDGELISVQSEMEKNVNKQLQSILREDITSQDSMGVKVAKDYYRSCLRVQASSPEQRQFMHSFVSNNGGLSDVKGTHWQPNYNWIDVIGDLRRNYGFDILIGVTVEKPNPNQNIIFIEEPQTTLLPVEICSSLGASQIDEKDQVFDKIQEEIKKNLQNWFELNESNASRIAGAIIRFEFDLCKYMRLEQTASTPLENEVEENGPQQEKELNYNRRSNFPRIVENRMHGVRQNTANNPQNLQTLSENYNIDFKKFISHSFSTISQVHLRSEEYFQQLSTIAKKGLQASFANYIMYRALSEINFPLNERNGQRPFHCINQLTRYLPKVLEKLYNEKFNNMDGQTDMIKPIHEIFLTIKETFGEYFKVTSPGSLDWMDHNTKKYIRQKLNNIKIIYPSYQQNEDIIRGFSFNNDQHNFWHKLQNIMMYSANQSQVRLTNFKEAPAVSIKQNPISYDIVVGYGLLQKPFYSLYYSRSLMYSSIGIAIAREIVKMLDLQYLQQNYKNTFSLNTSTLTNFSLISECFRAQISNNFHNDPNVFRNATQIYEIMVETSALNIAFSAYLTWLERIDPRSDELQFETLPDINFTNTQLFFINFAQTHCAARNNIELVPEFLPLYRRTMEQYNINGPLSNSMEFGRDFNCNVGTDMNLDDKCTLY